MKPCRTILLSFLLMLVAFPALAMEQHTEVLRDQYGRAIGGATVSVYNAGTSVLATIYSDNGSTAKSNPFLTNALDGSFSFYAANGVYDITFAYPGVTFDASLTRRIALFDLNDYGGGGGGGTASCYRSVTAITYTVVAADNNCVVEFSNASSIAVTLPQAGTTGFTASFRFTALNRGVGDVVITPTTSTIQGNSTLTLTTGQSTDIQSDGTNYVYTPGIVPASGWPTVNVADGVTWANSFANAFKVGKDTSNYWALYHDVSNGLQFVGVCGGVLNACNYVRQLASGQYAEWQNSSGTNIGRLTESTGAWTNFTLDVEASGNIVTLPFRWDLDMCGVSPTDGTTTGHVWNRDPLSTAPTATADVDTNRGRCVLNFPDTDTTYGVQITRQIPDGTLTGNFGMDVWWDTTGTGNARFQVQTKCYADDEADDAAFNTASVVTAAAGTSGRPNKVTLSSIDVTGCAGGELMRIRFFRVRTEASDTLNAALNVEKVVFKGRVIE